MNPSDNAVDLTQRLQETMLLAVSPDELQAGHSAMRSWATSMAEMMGDEAQGLEEAVARAKQMKWAHTTLARACNLAKRRRDFYLKIVSALDAGYLMIPNFPMNNWVIRTDRGRPRGSAQENRWGVGRWFPQEPGLLPEGDGRYVAAGATYSHEEQTRKDSHGKDYKVNVSWPDGFDESPDFPLAFAAPYVMEKAVAALQRRVFDEIGVADGDSSGDPIMIGRLRNPKPRGPAVSFFIAWSMDLRRV